LDGSAATHPSKASGNSAFGEGGSMIVVADRFSAAVGCSVWPKAQAAPQLNATETAEIAIQRFKKAPRFFRRASSLFEPGPNLQGTRSRRALAL
jgi:hypothetical protein